MTRIALLSDTHGHFDERVAHYLAGADEIWHAGDFGSAALVDELRGLAPVFRGVYGNIDGADASRFLGAVKKRIEAGEYEDDLGL